MYPNIHSDIILVFIILDFNNLIKKISNYNIQIYFLHPVQSLTPIKLNENVYIIVDIDDKYKTRLDQILLHQDEVGIH